MLELRYLASELAAKVQGTLVGQDLYISGIATLATASSSDISFLSNSRYSSQLSSTLAGVVLVKSSDQAAVVGCAIVVDDPYLSYAKISALFDTTSDHGVGVHASAWVASDASIDPSAYISPGAVIEAGASIGARVFVGSNTVVGAGASVGADSRLAANVTLYPGVSIGQRCLIHSAAVIGSDGFGFAPNKGRWQKISQLGSVVIGDNVEVGAGTTIDRGALNDTVIEQGVKLDNQIQIAHNVVVGENTAIAGGCAIAGSTKVGKQCTIAGMSGITGHLEIADGTHITAMTLVSRSITEPGAYSSGTALEPHRSWKRNAVRFRQLDELTQRVKELEKLVMQLSQEGQDK